MFKVNQNVWLCSPADLPCGIFAAIVIRDRGCDYVTVSTFGGQYEILRSCVFDTFVSALTSYGAWTPEEKEWAKHFLHGSTYIPAKWTDADIKQARESIRSSRNALVVPRQPDPLERCGIDKHEITPDTVIVITHPIDHCEPSLHEYVMSLSRLTSRPVVVIPEGFRFSKMTLAEIRQLREQLNAIIYDLERSDK